jgi:type IV secretion system protein VirB3
MFLGVPYIPFFIGASAGLLPAFYFNMWFLVLAPIFIFIMRMMAKRDEMIFRLLGLRLQFRIKIRNLQQHAGMWIFSANAYRGSAGKARK